MKQTYFEIEGQEKMDISTFSDISNVDNIEISNKCNLLEKTKGISVDLRQDLLGSCSKTILYTLFLYKNRVKPLFDNMDGYVVIPFQRLVENKLVWKKVLSDKELVNRYITWINYLSVSKIQITNENIKYIYPIMSEEMRKKTGVEVAYEKVLRWEYINNIEIYWSIISFITPRMDTREIVIKLNKDIVNIVISTIWWFTKYEWEEIHKLWNLFSVKMFLELIKKYNLNKWKYSIKISNVEDKFDIKFPRWKKKRELSEAQKKKHFDRFFLKPFIEKIKENIIILKIINYDYIKNKNWEIVLNISYKVKKKITEDNDVNKSITYIQDIINNVKNIFTNNNLEKLFNWDAFYQVLNEWYFKELISNNKEDIIMDYIKALIEVVKEDKLDWSFLYWKLLTAKNDISLYEKTWIKNFKQLLNFLILLKDFEKFSIQEKTKIIKLLNKNNRDKEYLRKVINFINNNNRVENKKAYLISMLTNNSEASELKKQTDTPKNFLKKDNEDFGSKFRINTVKI